MTEKELAALEHLLEVVNECGYGLKTLRAYHQIKQWIEKQKETND